MAEIVEELNDIEDPVLEDIPHSVSTLLNPTAYGTGSYPQGPPGRHFNIRFTVSTNPLRKP